MKPLTLAGVILLVAELTQAQSLSPEALVKAYPAQLASQDGASLVWRDGTRQPLSDGKSKTFDQKLKNASLVDQLSLSYPLGPPSYTPGAEDDPGRFRNSAFFDKMYGDCKNGGVEGRLVTISWVGGERLKVTSVNGVAEHLRKIARELDQLPESLRRFTYPSAGTYSCRTVADTGKRSMHAYGAAIDINTKYSDYWMWSRGAYRNRIPYEIVEIFEKHGFIWGGKWGHFDTMHFEYRPEFFVGYDKGSMDKVPH